MSNTPIPQTHKHIIAFPRSYSEEWQSFPSSRNEHLWMPGLEAINHRVLFLVDSNQKLLPCWNLLLRLVTLLPYSTVYNKALSKIQMCKINEFNFHTSAGVSIRNYGQNNSRFSVHVFICLIFQLPGLVQFLNSTGYARNRPGIILM